MEENNNSTTKIVAGGVIAVVVLAVVVFAGYKYSQKADGGESFPPSDSQPVKNPAGDESTASAEDNTPIIWQTYTNNTFKFTLSYPSSLKTRAFPNPKGELGIFLEKDAKTNMLVSVDNYATRSAERQAMDSETYVKSYYQMFPGLKGLKSADKFTNAVGEVGWKAIYINTTNQTPNIDIFFEAVDGSHDLVHFSKGSIDEKIFSQVVDTFKFIR